MGHFLEYIRISCSLSDSSDHYAGRLYVQFWISGRGHAKKGKWWSEVSFWINWERSERSAANAGSTPGKGWQYLSCYVGGRTDTWKHQKCRLRWVGQIQGTDRTGARRSYPIQLRGIGCFKKAAVYTDQILRWGGISCEKEWRNAVRHASNSTGFEQRVEMANLRFRLSDWPDTSYS